MSYKPFFITAVTVVLLLGTALFVQNIQSQYDNPLDYSQVSVIEDVLHQDSFIQYTLYQVTLADEYLCGTIISTNENSRYAASLKEVTRQFPDYIVAKVEGDHIFLHREHIELHPDMVGNSFFGLNAKNELVLYHRNEGPESMHAKVFFPLSQEALDEWIPEEQIFLLKKGILINSLGDYNSILSTFNEYIIDFPYMHP